MTNWQQIYLSHVKRQRKAGLSYLSLITFYDTVFEPLVIPVFLKVKL